MVETGSGERSGTINSVAQSAGTFQLCFSRTDRHLKRVTMTWKLVPSQEFNKPAAAEKIEVMQWQL